MAKNKGSKPKNAGQNLKETPTAATEDEQIHLSLRHEQSGYRVEDLTEHQRSEFLIKWAKRCQHSWKQIGQHPKHGLGFELLAADKMKPMVPERLAQDRYMVFRHEGNLPVVGFKAGPVFYPLWFEARYNDVYDHN